MIAAYIIAGAFLGFHSLMILLEFSPRGDREIPKGNTLMMAFVGGVAGHLVWHLVYT